MLAILGEGDKDLEDFLTMQKMFPDIRTGNGSIAIASSENTTESKATFKKSKTNSVFGYYVQKGLTREKALMLMVAKKPIKMQMEICLKSQNGLHILRNGRNSRQSYIRPSM